MTTFIFTVIYFIGYIVTARKLDLVVRQEFIDETSIGDRTDDAFGTYMFRTLILMLSTLWPLAIAYIVFAKPNKTSKQIEKENEALHKRIAELERELGIGDYQ